MSISILGLSSNTFNCWTQIFEVTCHFPVFSGFVEKTSSCSTPFTNGITYTVESFDLSKHIVLQSRLDLFIQCLRV